MLKTNRIVPQFRYNIESQRFIASNGRYVARETVKAGGEAIAQQSKAEIEAVSLRLQSGEITHAQWDAAMRDSIRKQVLAETALASGGVENMDARKYGRAGRICREQYKFLNGMGERIQNGYYGDDLSKNGFMNHAKSYGLNGRGVFEYAQGMNAIEELGHNEVCNEIDERVEGHCQGEGSCTFVTRLGWVKVDSDTFKKDWTWPGGRLCQNNCQCRAKSRKSNGDKQRAE